VELGYPVVLGVQVITGDRSPHVHPPSQE